MTDAQLKNLLRRLADQLADKLPDGTNVLVLVERPAGDGKYVSSYASNVDRDRFAEWVRAAAESAASVEGSRN